VINAVLITLGVLSAGMGIKGFLLSSNFIDGGVTGVSMLLSKTTPVPLPVWVLVVNLPFIFLGYHQIGRAFALRSVAAIAGLAAAIYVVPYPDVTPDKVLTAIFGGFCLGAGIGLAIRGGAVLDGTEVAAVLISKKSHALRVGDVILIFNTVLFLLAIKILGVEQALYSILTYFAAARTLDFVLYGLEQYTVITIVSVKSAEIRERIVGELGQGLTVYQGYGGKTMEKEEILSCVVTRFEIGKVLAVVRGVDPAAFVTYHPLAAAEGGVIKKPIHA
jgi:uncharacterized membrane-anchored protein YitT (DUF2179 family)